MWPKSRKPWNTCAIEHKQQCAIMKIFQLYFPHFVYRFIPFFSHPRKPESTCPYLIFFKRSRRGYVRLETDMSRRDAIVITRSIAVPANFRIRDYAIIVVIVSRVLPYHRATERPTERPIVIIPFRSALAICKVTARVLSRRRGIAREANAADLTQICWPAWPGSNGFSVWSRYPVAPE